MRIAPGAGCTRDHLHVLRTTIINCGLPDLGSKRGGSDEPPQPTGLVHIHVRLCSTIPHVHMRLISSLTPDTYRGAPPEAACPSAQLALVALFERPQVVAWVGTAAERGYAHPHDTCRPAPQPRWGLQLPECWTETLEIEGRGWHQLAHAYP